MTKRPPAAQAAYEEAFAAETDRIRDILAEGRTVGNSTLAEYLAFDTRMSADEAKAILEVSVVSKETGKMERGRSDAEAYAKRRAADSVIGTREVAERNVAAILQESGGDRRTASAAAIARGWKKATACINIGNGFDEHEKPAAGPTSSTTAARGWKAAAARANALLD